MKRKPQILREARAVLLVAMVAVTLFSAAPIRAAPARQEVSADDPLVVSFVGAAGWLDNLPAEDRDDQIRDYALLGLASILGMDLPALRDALYDQTPVRDPLFWDLAANGSGPGRGLYDGEGTLHVLVPQDDAYADRTIGLVLDDHRKNTGSDPKQVVLYHYTIDHANQEVLLVQEPTQLAADVRQTHGYVEMSIRNLVDLERFLNRTQHLSQITISDGTMRVGGWNWPGVPVGQVTAEDITVLQRGYLNARGKVVTVVQFITENLAPLYGLEQTVSAEVKARASELDAFFTAWEQAEGEDDYIDVLTEYEDLVLSVIIDDNTASQLERSRGNMSGIVWFNDYAEAYIDALENNELWGTLWFVASGELYLPQEGVTEPGFSLDPGPVMSMEELLSILPADLYPELAGRHPEVLSFVERYLSDMGPEAFWDFLAEHEDFILDVVLSAEASAQAKALLKTAETTYSEDEWSKAIGEYLDLIQAALSDPDKPWSLLIYAAQGETTYQYARYDGGLQGTEAGMTYFYTDILAKGYFYELGQGNPYGIVEGFLPKSQSVVPWSHCTIEDQQGRIWFGLREEAVGLFPEQVNLGSVATRVFVLMEDPVFGEQEIEPSYMFGQGVWWWDRHYQAMADYEPQYHRLDQLMRWGAALAWLVDRNEVLLPTVSMDKIEEGWRFDAWLEAHPELTWQYDVPFVDVPEQPTESVLRLFSLPHEQCGKSWVSSGGISNPSMGRIAEIAGARPELPQPLARAGMDAAATDYSTRSMAGTIASLDGIRRTLEPIVEEEAVIDVVANGRKVWSLGNVKLALPETTERRLKTAIAEREQAIAWQLDVQGVRLGEIHTSVDGTKATIHWEEGPLARVQPLLDQLQDLLLEYAPEVALEMLTGDASTDSDAETYYVPVNAEGEEPQWLVISDIPPSSEESLSFRLAKPDASTATITWYYASLTNQLPLNAEPVP